MIATLQQQILPRFHFPKYGFAFLLVCLMLMQILPPAVFDFDGGENMTSLVMVVILLSCLYLVVKTRTQLFIGMSMFFSIQVIDWLDLPLPNEVQYTMGSALVIIYLCYTGIFVGRYLFDSERVNADKIFAALCLYFLFVLVWTHVYLVIEIWTPGSFTIAGWSLLDEDTRIRLYNEFYYFSGVTMTTLGYGDISPITNVARSWVTLQAIVGQFYLTIVIARLMGLYITESLSHRAQNRAKGNREDE